MPTPGSVPGHGFWPAVQPGHGLLFLAGQVQQWTFPGLADTARLTDSFLLRAGLAGAEPEQKD